MIVVDAVSIPVSNPTSDHVMEEISSFYPKYCKLSSAPMPYRAYLMSGARAVSGGDGKLADVLMSRHIQDVGLEIFLDRERLHRRAVHGEHITGPLTMMA